MVPRKSDVNRKELHRYVRNSRFKETAEGWFFITREGLSLGPYATDFDAELSASLLIARLAQLEKGADTKSVIAEYMNDPANPIIRQTNVDLVDLNKIRRNQRKKARTALVQKAWSMLASVAAAQKSNG